MIVQFDEQNSYSSSSLQNEPTGFTAFLIKRGIAKDVSGANKIQVILVVLCIISSIVTYIAINSGQSDTNKQLEKEIMRINGTSYRK